MTNPLPGQLALPLLGLREGRRRRDAGMAQAAEAQGTQWGEYAYGLLVELAERQQEVHTDDLAAVLEWHPTHPNAAGSVWQRAIRAGALKKSGRSKPSKDPNKNAHDYPIYLSSIYRHPTKGEYAEAPR